jgi:beta-N-acetylhexosaminidase
MKRKAIITSISGTTLTHKERKLIRNEKPWGIILFKRNITKLTQVKDLVKRIRVAAQDKNFPILVDEEGGTVSRISELLDNKIYSQKFFGDLFKVNKKIAFYLYKNYIFSICAVLRLIGVNINTVPVLDISKRNTHKVIGTRSFSEDKSIIKTLGKLCCDTYKFNKISTVIKHIPGHGSSNLDSHKSTPKVNLSYKELLNNDFNCFKNVNSLLAMTAHIVYTKIDPYNVATHSKLIINNIIRKKIGFKGILLSDDIAMKSLKFDLVTNAIKSLNAGCNLVLYCGGNIIDSKKLLKHMPMIDEFTIKKTSEFYKFLS